MTRGTRSLVFASLATALLLIAPTSVLAQGVEATGPAPDSQVATEDLRQPAFAQLFEDTLKDFRRLPSRDTLTWLGIGAAAAALTHMADQPVTERLSNSKFFEETFEAGQFLGGASFQHGSALATYIIGRAMHKPRVASVGAYLLQAQLIAQGLTEAVKKGVGRRRPDGTGYSFPSGHASVTFATATVLQRDLGWKVGIPAYGLAAYVAASRVQVKRHFLSDVAFGAVIGIISGRVVTVGRGDRRFAVSPMALPGGGGVSFAWVGSQQAGASPLH